jgi:ribonuclease T2
MLQYLPTASLIQHEWSTHGTCSGLNASDYFAAVRKARDSIRIPAPLNSLTEQTVLSAAQIEAEFAAANPGFPLAAFRATCAGGRLQEARICLDKSVAPRACTASAGECALPRMTILPPR